jgi:hypothetical protein
VQPHPFGFGPIVKRRQLKDRRAFGADRDPALKELPTGALLDRLTHHVHILEMNGESYRLATAKKAQRRNRDPVNAPPIEKGGANTEN